MPVWGIDRSSMTAQATSAASPTSATFSEAEALALRCGDGVVRLKEGSWKTLLKSMPKLGVIRCHTRNRAVIHERVGPYRWVRFLLSAGQTGGPEIDLRLFMRHWANGFSVTEQGENGVQRSFQFFNPYGQAVHKVFLLPESNVSAFEAITEKFASPDQERRLTVAPRRQRVEKPDSEVDLEGFHRKWRKMWDTHQFFRLHRKYGLGRLQALRLGPPELVHPLELNAARRLFEIAAEDGLGFMTFSGNAGCLQIHNGPASDLSNGGEWFRVREGGFLLEIHEPSIAHAYVVKKPTLFGNVSSVELFDARGENVAVFYGKRGRLEREHADWRQLVEKMPLRETCESGH